MTSRRQMGQFPVHFPVGGGLDLITPAIAKPPGRAIASLNYAPTAAGYKRLQGFERYDGNESPSDGLWWVIHYAGGNSTLGAAVVGATLSATSGTTWSGFMAIAPVVTSGSFAAGTAAGFLVAVSPQGTFPVGAALQVAGITGATSTTDYVSQELVTATALPDGTVVATDAFLLAVSTAKRPIITAVPGSGPVRGVMYQSGGVLAVRDNAGATAGVMFKATSAGWSAVIMGRTFNFTTGNFAPTLGDTVTQGGTTGTVISFALASGSWDAGTAAGTIVIEATSGAFTAAAITDGSHSNFLTLTNTGTAYALPPGGTYEFIEHNFYGASNLTRIYGINGVGKAFVYDPVANVLAPITTGMTIDTPTHIAHHRGSLFLSFPGGSVQFSVVGNPLLFNAVVGAGEIGVGSDVTSLVPANDTTLGIFTKESINLLYGNDSTDYQLQTLTDQAGALPSTSQKLGTVLYMDNGGLRSLSASAAYGNFTMGSLSQMIEPLLKALRLASINPVASLVVRRSGQYWLFFSDGSALIVYMGKKQPEILPANLGKTVSCCISAEDKVTGIERIFFGASDGFVYELNKDTGFDGAVIDHYVRFAFNHMGSPDVRKRYHKVTVDMTANGNATVSILVDFDYGETPTYDPTLIQFTPFDPFGGGGPVTPILPDPITVTTGGSSIAYLSTNETYYASQLEAIAVADIDGVANNISLKVAGSTSTEQPHTLTGVTYHVTMRGLQR